jgi:Raf kinase inhibitor-like YbhB/YbcL family protein
MRVLFLSIERHSGNVEPTMPLMLASPAIPPSGEIPSQYTCDGADISPPLTWSGLPSGTQSLIVVVEDPDAPSGVFHHWAAFGMPAGSRGLDAGCSKTRPAAGFQEAHNDLGKSDYGDPCPPKGHGTHHYHFHLLALSRPTLDLKAPATGLDVVRAAEPYVIERTELVGTYHR